MLQSSQHNQLSEQKGVTSLRRVLRWSVLACLVMCGVGCLQPRMFTERYLQLNINALSSETGHLQIKVTPCQGGVKAGDPLEQERTVKLRLGSELFYVPPSLKGTLDIKVYGYRTSAKKTIVQYARTMVSLNEGQRVFPTLTLHTGRPEQEPFWCERPQVQPPVERKKPFQYQEELSLKTPAVGQPGLPPLGTNPHDVPVPPTKPPVPPSDFSDLDRAILRSPLLWRRATLAVAASGRLVAIVNKADEQKQTPASVSVFDVVSGFEFQNIELVPGCSPTGLDIQGNLIALLCAGPGRLFFFKVDSGAAYGPPEGVLVGLQPVAVRMSGHVVVVANRNSQEVLVMRIGQWNTIPKTISVGETPSAIAAVNGRFFVASAQSNSVTSFQLDSNLKQQGDSTPYQVGKTPVSVAANGHYFVTANAGSANITIWNSIGTKFRTLYLGGTPFAIKLLNHTAIVSDIGTNRLHIVDLRIGRVTQSLPMQQAISHLALAGEWLLCSSPKSGALARATFRSRSGLVHFRVGARPRYVHVAGGKALVHDPLAGLLNEVDLRRHHITKQHPLRSDGWMSGTDALLLHTSTKSTLVIRELRALSKQVYSRRFDAPIQHGRIVTTRANGKITGQTAHLLLWDRDGVGSSRIASIFTIRDLHLPQDKWQFEGPTPLAFAASALEPTDVLPWKNGQILIVDERNRALFLVDPAGGKLLRSLELTSRPLQMEFIGEELALLLDDGSLWMIDVTKLTKSRSFRLAENSGQVGQMRVFNGLIAFTHYHKGHVSFVDPATTQTVATFRVGCDPVGLNFWRNPADTTSWRHLLVVANRCGESLSLYPLDLGSYTK